jgi:hypothetical protein
MVLPLITSTIVAAVAGSWTAASISIKYFLAGLVAKNLYERTLTREAFLEDVLESGEPVLLLLIGAGTVFAVTGLSPAPFLKLFSELVALSYFAYLFWKY